MLKSKLESILAKTFTQQQLVTFGLIPSQDSTLNLDNFNNTFLNRLNADKTDITFVVENDELFVILGKVENSCLNGNFHYNTYNLSKNGIPTIKQFSNK